MRHRRSISGTLETLDVTVDAGKAVNVDFDLQAAPDVWTGAVGA